MTTNKEMEPYVVLAQGHNIPVFLIECHGEYGSIHNVPEEAIRHMKNRWEEPNAFWFEEIESHAV
jgi:DNA gyrase/topoisomerase IV subunit A